MADVTLTIPLPVLQAGEQFKYRYRTYPSGSFGAYAFTSTQQISLTGLANGEYELEVLLVKADLTECPASLKRFIIVPPFSCYSFGASIIQSGSQYVLRIVYALPSPIVNPACSWKISYQPVGYATQILTYSSLPLSGIINITLPANVDVNLTIYGDLCNNNLQFCFEDQIPKIPTPNCTPMVLASYDLQYVNGIWGIRLFGTNSNPATPIYTFNYSETSLLNIGATPDSGTFTFAGGAGGAAFLYSITGLNPQGIYLQGNPGEFLPNCIRYTGSIVDICGNSHVFNVSGFWQPSGAAGQGVFIASPC